MRQFVFCGLASLFLAGTLVADDYRPAPGERHRDFLLPNIADRKPVSLADFRGKKVLLFHFASW